MDILVTHSHFKLLLLLSATTQPVSLLLTLPHCKNGFVVFTKIVTVTQCKYGYNNVYITFMCSFHTGVSIFHRYNCHSNTVLSYELPFVRMTSAINIINNLLF